MLAFQTMNAKRRRDGESDSEDERYLKKSRPWNVQRRNGQAQHHPSPASLPLRPSTMPSPPQLVAHLGTMTPDQSEHSDAGSPASFRDNAVLPASPHSDMDYSMQTDEDDLDVIASQPPDSPFVVTNFRPAMLNADLFSRDPASNTDRMPTPMYPNFHSNGMAGLGYPSSGMAGGMSMGNGFLSAQSSTTPIMQPPPARKQGSHVEQDRTRRMPSPISEDDDLPDTPTALTQSQLSRLSVASDRMDTEMVPPATAPTPTRGRKRSGALTGMGRFSMGYREDCEKCKQRVPGHYSHFLP